VVPVTVKVFFAFFTRPRTWMDPLDDEVLIVALWPEFAMALNVVQGDIVVGAEKTTMRVTPPTAAVTVQDPERTGHSPGTDAATVTGDDATVTGEDATDSPEVPPVFFALALTV